MTTEQLEAEYQKHHAAYSARLDELKTAEAIDRDDEAYRLWEVQAYWWRRFGEAVQTDGKSEYKYN